MSKKKDRKNSSGLFLSQRFEKKPGPSPYNDDGKSQKSEFHRQAMYDKLANVRWDLSEAEEVAMVFPYGNQNKYYDKKI